MAAKKPDDLLTNLIQRATGAKTDADKKVATSGEDPPKDPPPVKGSNDAKKADPAVKQASSDKRQAQSPPKQGPTESLRDDQRNDAKKASSTSSGSSSTLTTTTDQLPPYKEGMTIEKLTQIGEELIKTIAKENATIRQRVQTLNKLTRLVLNFTETAHKQTSLEPLLPELEELIKAFADVTPNDFRQERRRTKSLEMTRPLND